MTQPIIVGAGVAGFSAALRLAELGVPAIVLEAAAGPVQRVCGEFISPEALPVLKRWGVEPAAVLRRARFVLGDRSLEFDFPWHAGGLSRLTCEQRLAEAAQRAGVDVRWSCEVKTVRPLSDRGRYEIELARGHVLTTSCLLVAAGRSFQWSSTGPAPSGPPLRRFAGIKAHFKGLELRDCMEMHVLPGAYVGVSAIENQETNVACLVSRETLEAMGGAAEELWQGLLRLPEASGLRERVAGTTRVFPQWLFAQVPSFGVRSHPQWPQVYFIGDAAAAIPPLSGDGMGMAVTGGAMAAEYAIRGESEAFARDWKKRYSSRIRWARGLQHCLMRPKLSRLTFSLCRGWQGLPQLLFRFTREVPG